MPKISEILPNNCNLGNDLMNWWEAYWQWLKKKKACEERNKKKERERYFYVEA